MNKKMFILAVAIALAVAGAVLFPYHTTESDREICEQIRYRKVVSSSGNVVVCEDEVIKGDNYDIVLSDKRAKVILDDNNEIEEIRVERC